MSPPYGTPTRETLALIVPTRNRVEYLRVRIPVYARAGFDQVIIVDTPTDPARAEELRALCAKYGVQYVGTPSTFRDLRSKARNLGAKVAKTAWIFFLDDDVYAPIGIDWAAFESAAKDRDWLAGPRGDIVVIHRRDAFLRFGGYPEDMVASEDDIMSNRARRCGRGGPLHSRWITTIGFDERPRNEPINRARSLFWYSLTLPAFFLRTSHFALAVGSDARRLLRLGRVSLSGSFVSLVYLSVYVVGRLLSPLHLIGILWRSGFGGLAREPEAPWSDARRVNAEEEGS